MTTTVDGVDAFHEWAGKELGHSEWQTITQERVNLFADATDDHQWIHVDPERAAAGPFGATIAHGYLTVALSNLFLPQIVDVQGVSMGINYGADKVRFPSPVTVGSMIRGGAELVSATDVNGGIQTTMLVTIEIEGATKPACIIESLSRFLT